jgi:hypothetical protein
MPSPSWKDSITSKRLACITVDELNSLRLFRGWDWANFYEIHDVTPKNKDLTIGQAYFISFGQFLLTNIL